MPSDLTTRDDAEEGVSEDMLPTLVRWFEDAENQSQDAREKAERDRDYYDNKQYTVITKKCAKTVT